ncbi:homoprotocatechuate degradation operon regulator HpaR [Glaciimonas sp. CA11.2]|uniref:homoprotocatechuate degradation operon regulator HpaR n=1 Tax=Glaciimonas sp. CA11.2 TaxID=3048601 RepID=UPI002AB56ABC|nr:homoprotocatechuate degradation operon regulator HpaR [Glaciimonas sp. CA11.2]MDY7546818.1 homoprotocatechuate degradation operon regulator HpaR [Glaciimonas sp. CA11.2]MEB0163526.1 homoprotocatechuate degradation operon regulator HpaR [Glaciimonas sp. CA11.2]
MAHRNLPQLFLKARERLMSHFRPILNHFGVTEQQWRILRLLDEHVQLEPRELCEMCQILSSSMTGVLTRMEEVGLISRNAVADDRRRVLVRLAPSGDQLISEIAPLIDLQYQHIEQAFGKPVIVNLLNAFEGFIAVEPESVLHVTLSQRSTDLRAAKSQVKRPAESEKHSADGRKGRKK